MGLVEVLELVWIVEVGDWKSLQFNILFIFINSEVLSILRNSNIESIIFQLLDIRVKHSHHLSVGQFEFSRIDSLEHIDLIEPFIGLVQVMT